VLGGLTLAAGSSSAASGAVAAARAPHQVVAAGLSSRGLPILLGGVLVVAGLGIGLPLLRRLMPTGTLTARYGLPATVLSRSLLTFTFFGADAFVTLTITILRHHSPVVAGVAVTGSTLAWTAGAWVQARMNTRWEGRRLVRTGLSIILFGIAGLALMLSSKISVVVGIAAWTIAGFGMGLSYAPITLLMLKAAPTGREGWASASLNLADVLGSAMGIGIGGAAITAAITLGWPLAAGIGTAFTVTAAAGATCLAISRRLPLRADQPSHPAAAPAPELNPT
jgi:MFS family permease